MKTAIHIQPKVLKSKRLFDICLSVITLALTWPLMIVVAILVKISSSGPVIYKQRRVGRAWYNKTEFFDMYKFRTMTHQAESNTGAVWAVENDPRLTLMGKFLRKTRLDELPQLFNVIRGDMSLVGPRPERPEIVINLDEKIPYYSERTYGVLPGITGLAQVSQGYDTSIEDVKSKILYDFAYSLSLTTIGKWMWMDFSIACRTLYIMVMGRGQ